MLDNVILRVCVCNDVAPIALLLSERPWHCYSKCKLDMKIKMVYVLIYL
jgi:hypothetical protein